MDAAVTFRFRLPPVLMLRALGRWPRSPRGVTLDLDAGGDVVVRGYDGLEATARHQALTAAASFLRADSNVPPMTIPAQLFAPYSDRPISYAISLGARVSIARTSEAPLVTGAPAVALVG